MAITPGNTSGTGSQTTTNTTTGDLFFEADAPADVNNGVAAAEIVVRCAAASAVGIQVQIDGIHTAGASGEWAPLAAGESLTFFRLNHAGFQGIRSARVRVASGTGTITWDVTGK